MRGHSRIILSPRRVFYIGIIVLFLLFIFLFFDVGIIHFSKQSTPQDFFIDDRCSLIAGKLIHVINNEGNCRVMCRAECEVRSLSFSNASFLEREQACNQCHCSCT